MSDVTSPADLTGGDWAARFAEALNVSPLTDHEVASLLELAATAAHASERLAAPLACYLVGRAGVPIEAAQSIAATIAG
ncbi:MAG: DUF6457 domain-containing protein [Actinomycetes bacterium]